VLGRNCNPVSVTLFELKTVDRMGTLHERRVTIVPHRTRQRQAFVVLTAASMPAMQLRDWVLFRSEPRTDSAHITGSVYRMPRLLHHTRERRHVNRRLRVRARQGSAPWRSKLQLRVPAWPDSAFRHLQNVPDWIQRRSRRFRMSSLRRGLLRAD
jgi:hypothetical protein